MEIEVLIHLYSGILTIVCIVILYPLAGDNVEQLNYTVDTTVDGVRCLAVKRINDSDDLAYELTDCNRKERFICQTERQEKLITTLDVQAATGSGDAEAIDGSGELGPLISTEDTTRFQDVKTSTEHTRHVPTTTTPNQSTEHTRHVPTTTTPNQSTEHPRHVPTTTTPNQSTKHPRHDPTTTTPNQSTEHPRHVPTTTTPNKSTEHQRHVPTTTTPNQSTEHPRHVPTTTPNQSTKHPRHDRPTTTTPNKSTEHPRHVPTTTPNQSTERTRHVPTTTTPNQSTEHVVQTAPLGTQDERTSPGVVVGAVIGCCVIIIIVISVVVYIKKKKSSTAISLQGPNVLGTEPLMLKSSGARPSGQLKFINGEYRSQFEDDSYELQDMDIESTL